MQLKKIIALIISIIIVIGIGLAIWYVNKNSNQKNSNIYSQNSNNSEEQGEKTMIQTDDGLIFIKGGTFQMGSPENEAQRNEDEEQHSVTVSDFYIGKYEITRERISRNNRSKS